MSLPVFNLLAIARWLTILLPVFLLAGTAPLDVCAIVIAVLFLAHSIIARDFAWLHVRWVQWAGILWIYMCLRNLGAPDVLEALGRSGSYIRFPLFAAALAYWILPDARTRRRLWYVLAACLVFLIADTGWQYVHGTDITGRAIIPIWGGAVRLTGPFSSPRVGITILWLLFPIVLPLLAQGKARWRMLAGMLMAGGGAAIYLSGERMALLLWLGGILLSLLLCTSARRWCIVAILSATATLALLSSQDATLLKRQYTETRVQMEAFGNSVYGRTWNAAVAIGRNYPVWGLGSKQFTPECKKPLYGLTDKESLELRCPLHAHNMYLEMLVEFGLVGVALFLLLISAWVRDGCSSIARWRAEPLLLALLITMALRLWPISVTPSQFIAWAAIPFWMALGWFYALLNTKPEAPHD